jgi:hypothetical protein
MPSARNTRGAMGPLSYLKLRGAYGAVGREPTPYQILDSYSGAPIGLDYGGGSTSPDPERQRRCREQPGEGDAQP